MNPLKLSRYGQRYSAQSGIIDLMEDLGSALRENPGMLMMAGGNPARIAQAEQLFQRTLHAILADADSSHAMLGRYQGPKGDLLIRQVLAQHLQAYYGWPVTADHIAVTNGGQSAFGILANMLAGDSEDGLRRLHFPLVPEYLGYADVGIAPRMFSAARPRIALLPDRFFKYELDEQAPIPASAAALCISRPTNPSGNVLTDAEVRLLDDKARQADIPFIVDAAYGLPFPALQYDSGTTPYWSDNVILMLSLSKVGLPGARCGFLVAAPALIEAFSSANTVLNLASGNLGPAIATPLLQSGDMQRLSQQVLRPWYAAKAATAVQALHDNLGDLPYHIHKPEGAFFLWLWFPDLPITCHEFYQQLRKEGLLVIPGATSFIGLDEPWQHTRECIRLSYAVDDATLRQGAAVLGRVLQRVYRTAA
jgi:valine--pyruvate aminotransferase